MMKKLIALLTAAFFALTLGTAFAADAPAPPTDERPGCGRKGTGRKSQEKEGKESKPSKKGKEGSSGCGS